MEINVTDLYIIYGSESKLLKKLYEKKNVFFFRIYNNRQPTPKENAVDVDSFPKFEKKFKKFMQTNTPKKIIFIGAAFLVQNELFVKEKKNHIALMLDTNIKTYLEYTHFLLPFMIKIKSGNFIFLSSFRTQATTRGVSVYAASKSFCETFFQIIGKEYGSIGVFSNSIRLGAFDGRMLNVLDSQKKMELKRTIGNRRFGTTEDLLKAIEFIIDSKYSNGGILDLTGGMSYN